MPNTAISVGKSVTCLCSNEYGKQKLVVAEAIFNNLGNAFLIEEKIHLIPDLFAQVELHFG